MSLSNSELASKIGNLITRWQTFMDEFKDWLTGEPNGGPNNDGKYPLTDAEGNTFYYKSIPAIQDTVDTLSEDAQTALNDAEGAAATAEDARDKAQLWAEETVDVEVEPGEFSSYHHRTKAEGAQSGAEQARNTAESHRDSAGSHASSADDHRISAEAARDKSQEWAEEAVDVEVETGAFSSYHHRTKSEDAQTGAESAESSALQHRDDAEQHKWGAQTAESGAQSAESTAEDHRDTADSHRVTAQRYANEDEDVTVIDEETGQDTESYSAYHWSRKAMAEATGGMFYRGGWDASTGTFPDDNPDPGDLYVVTTEGTVDGMTYYVGEMIIGDTDGNWDYVPDTDSVTSVAGKVGEVTLNKSDVGLGNVLDEKQATEADFDAHTGDTGNPHNVTASQVGLGNVRDVEQYSKSEVNTEVSNAESNAKSYTDSELNNMDRIDGTNGHEIKFNESSTWIEFNTNGSRTGLVCDEIYVGTWIDNTKVDQWETAYDRSPTGVYGSGNGNLHIQRHGLGDITTDLSHDHDGRYYTQSYLNDLGFGGGNAPSFPSGNARYVEDTSIHADWSFNGDPSDDTDLADNGWAILTMQRNSSSAFQLAGRTNNGHSGSNLMAIRQRADSGGFISDWHDWYEVAHSGHGIDTSDYVFDMYLDGEIDCEYYDSICTANDEERSEWKLHRPAREFESDELDIRDFTAKWMESHKLPAMQRYYENLPEGAKRPNFFSTIQALLETCEAQAVHIHKLEERLSALEEKLGE